MRFRVAALVLITLLSSRAALAKLPERYFQLLEELRDLNVLNAEAVDLAGWELRSGTSREVVEACVPIPAGGWVVLARSAEAASNGGHVIIKKTDGIEHGNSQARVSIVQHTGDGPQVIVNGGRGAMLAETGEPDGMLGIGEAGIDLHPAKAHPQRTGVGPGGLIVAPARVASAL